MQLSLQSALLRASMPHMVPDMYSSTFATTSKAKPFTLCGATMGIELIAGILGIVSAIVTILMVLQKLLR